MKNEVVCYDCDFREIDRQDWPDVPGTVFITKNPNVPANGQKWSVSMWVDDPVENVLGLGSFWDHRDAMLFATVKAEYGTVVKLEQQLKPQG